MIKIRTHIYINIILLVLVLGNANNARSQPAYHPLKNVEKFRQDMMDASARTNSIVSDFKQLKHLSFLEEDVESTGSFFFQKENRLRWEYYKPFYYLILFNNDTVLIRDEHKTNIYDAASGRMFREINEIMLSMVNGTILESNNFEFTYFENPSSYKLELTPLDRNMREFLTEIRLFINKKDLLVDELYMIEKSGDYTRIQFINKRLNADIPKHTFDLH